MRRVVYAAILATAFGTAIALEVFGTGLLLATVIDIFVVLAPVLTLGSLQLLGGSGWLPVLSWSLPVTVLMVLGIAIPTPWRGLAWAAALGISGGICLSERFSSWWFDHVSMRLWHAIRAVRSHMT